MLQMSGFENLVKEADLIVTGEGRADAQTLMGKIPACVLDAKRFMKNPPP